MVMDTLSTPGYRRRSAGHNVVMRKEGRIMDVSIVDEKEHVLCYAGCQRKGTAILACGLHQRFRGAFELGVKVPSTNACLHAFARPLVGSPACERQCNANELCEGGLHALLGRCPHECMYQYMVRAFRTSQHEYKQLVQLRGVLGVGRTGERPLNVRVRGSLVGTSYLSAYPVVAHAGSREPFNRLGGTPCSHFRASREAPWKSLPAGFLDTQVNSAEGIAFLGLHISGADRTTWVAAMLPFAESAHVRIASTRSSRPRRHLK